MTNIAPNEFTISVPIDKKAQVDFDYDIAKDEQVLVHRFFGNDVLWILNSGMIDIINDEIDVNIDSIEDEYLYDLVAIKRLIPKLRMIWPDSEIVAKILELFSEAVRLDTCVHIDIGR